MSKSKRICGENLYHHIYAWGNDRHPTFKTEKHYLFYLKLLENISRSLQIDVIAYALMKWHIHLFIFDRLNKISKFMDDLHGQYAQFFNKDTGQVGHVFGERFNNKIVQPNEYALWLSRYIHRQAVEAGIVSDPSEYPWTSYRQYIGLEPAKFIKPQIILEQFAGETGNQKEVHYLYKNFVLDEKEISIDWENRIQKIIGDQNFIKDVATTLSLKLLDVMNKEELLKNLCTELDITIEQLMNPCGIEEKRKRHKAIDIMIKKYRLRVAQISRMLKISRFTVMRNIESLH
ncbi:MAG: transposase [candidate division WOR-3 bacterium]